MTQLTDKQIKEVLQEYINKSCNEIDVDVSKYKPKAMLRIKRYDSMKSGYYVQIQNFRNAHQVKSKKKTKTVGDKKPKSYFRYTFRCIQFTKRKDYLLEISKWTPDMGVVDNDIVIFRSDSKKSDGLFLERMVITMNMVKLKL